MGSQLQRLDLLRFHIEILLNGSGGYLAKPKSPKLLAKKMLFSIDYYQESLLKNSKAKKYFYSDYRFTNGNSGPGNSFTRHSDRID